MCKLFDNKRFDETRSHHSVMIQGSGKLPASAVFAGLGQENIACQLDVQPPEYTPWRNFRNLITICNFTLYKKFTSSKPRALPLASACPPDGQAPDSCRIIRQPSRRRSGPAAGISLAYLCPDLAAWLRHFVATSLLPSMRQGVGGLPPLFCPLQFAMPAKGVALNYPLCALGWGRFKLPHRCDNLSHWCRVRNLR